MEKKSFRLEIKQTEEKGNIGKFEGYAAIFNKLDYNGDIILPGAFKRSIDLQGKERPLLWDHRTYDLIGGTVIGEDEKGLTIQGEINLDTQTGKEQFSNMQKGYLKTMSIGYNAISPDWIGDTRYLKEIALWETSLVTIAAMPNALVEVKAVVPYQNLPLAPDDWAPKKEEANMRVRIWAGGPDKDKINWSKYKRAFLWFDDKNPTKFTSYKLDIGDIIGGTLKAVPKGIFAVAGVLQGARGGVNIPQEDQDSIKNQLNKYYKKMGKEAPWNKKSLEQKTGKVVSQATAKQIQDTIDVLKGIQNVFAGLTTQQITKAIDTLSSLLGTEGAKSLLKNRELDKKDADTFSALIEDIKKFI